MDTSNYRKYYSSGKLADKVKSITTGSADGIIRVVVTLFVLLQQSSTPVWVKATIVGALGYFICPFDLVPDFLPLGLADDLLVVTTTLRFLYMYINEVTALEVEDLMSLWT